MGAYQEELDLRKILVKDKNNIFVMAGAGAGKTFSLVLRIINQLISGVKTSEIVAISFTNKSAEDLRSKIINALDINNNSEKKSKYTSEEIKIINQALNEIDMMHISTIHKFCGDIIRENSIYAKVSPDFKILLDDADTKRKDLVFNSYYHNLSKKDFYELDNSSNNYTNIKNIYYELTRYVEKLDFNDIYKPFDDEAKALKEIKDIIYDMLKLTDNYKYDLLDSANDGAKSNKYLEMSEIFKKDSPFNNDIDDKNLEELVSIFIKDQEVFDYPFNGNKLRKEKSKEIYQEFKDEFDLLKSRLKKYAGSYKLYIYLKYAYEAYLRYLDYIDNDFDNVSNDELIYLAKKLISDNKIVCDKLKNKYKHIYIDEYQDTDHIQRDIALLLTTINNNFNDDALFLVGDPKQSIYRFRGAEPEVYFETKDLFNKPNTKVYDLNINFRSNGKVLEYVNEVYQNIPLTKEKYQGMLIRDINEIDDKSYNNNENLLGFYYSVGIAPIDIAKLIIHIKKNYKVRVKQSDDSFKYQDIKYSDFMIQMPGHNMMSEYVNTFSAAKIPSKVAGEASFYEYYPIRVFVNLFEALNERGAKAKQMAYEAFRLIYFDKFNGKTKKEALDISSSLLLELKHKTYNMTSYGIAIFLVEHLKWIIKTNEKFEAFEVNSISSKLYQMIEDVFSTDYQNGSKVAKEMRKYISKGVEYESLIDDKADAVSIINVHKAKGLEAPIVIFVCNDKKKDKTGNIYYNNKLYLRYSSKLSFYNEEDPFYDEIKNAIDLELSRLEYVAATRPQEAFIYAISDDRNMFSKDEYKITSLRKIEALDYEDKPNEAYKEYSEKKYDILYSEKSLNIISPSGLENNTSKIRDEEKAKVIASGINTLTSRPKGNILGTVLHRAFELLVKEKLSFDEIINISINENIEDINEANIPSYKLFINTCLNKLDNMFKEDGIYKTNLYPELTFSYKKSKNTISNGSIDLLSINNGNYIIYDYKSDEAEYIIDDKLFEETLKEKYQNQLDEYESVVKDLFTDAKKISKKIIYFRRYDDKNKDIDVKICEL